MLNLSIGSNPVAPADFDPIAQAVEFAWKNGITVVCAAGNEGEFGPGGILSPGNSPYVITVGATDTRQTASLGDDAVTYYSSVGPTLWDEYAKPDLVAPGNRLISLRVKDSYIDTNFPQNLIPRGRLRARRRPRTTEPSYLMLSGTSTSAPGRGRRRGPHDRRGPEPEPGRRQGAHDGHRRPAARRHALPAGRRPPRRRRRTGERRAANGYALSEDVGDGTTILTEDDYAAWDQVAWTKYGWTKFRWTKFRWTKFRWTKFRWTGRRVDDEVPVDQVQVDRTSAWTKFRWTKFRWTRRTTGRSSGGRSSSEGQ